VQQKPHPPKGAAAVYDKEVVGPHLPIENLSCLSSRFSTTEKGRFVALAREKGKYTQPFSFA